MVSDNVPASRHHGAPKHGNALLAGLVRCRRCGRKLTVRYSGVKHNIPRYSYCRGQMDNGEPRCIAFGGLRVDNLIEEALLQVVTPGAILAAQQAESEVAEKRDQVREALSRDLEAAEYVTDRAFRQAQAKPIFDDLEVWLHAQLPSISSKSPLAGAIRYALTRMVRLRPYLDHGILELDNDTAERAMRSVAIGRKNYLFVGSQTAGEPTPLHASQTTRSTASMTCCHGKLPRRAVKPDAYPVTLITSGKTPPNIFDTQLCNLVYG